MKIAIPTRENHVDDHFGHCAFYSVYGIENGRIISSETVESPQGCGCKTNIASKLKDMGVTLMLAGNMGAGAKTKLEESGIEVIRGCSGAVTVVLASFLAGTLNDSGVGCNHTHEDGHVCNSHS